MEKQDLKRKIDIKEHKENCHKELHTIFASKYVERAFNASMYILGGALILAVFNLVIGKYVK